MKRPGRPKGSKNKAKAPKVAKKRGRPRKSTGLTAADLRKLDLAMGIKAGRGRPKTPPWMKAGYKPKAAKKKDGRKKPRHLKTSLAKRYGGNPHKQPGHVPNNILIDRYNELSALIARGGTPGGKPMSLLRARQAKLRAVLSRRG
jgi:hypothetical protein